MRGRKAGGIGKIRSFFFLIIIFLLHVGKIPVDNGGKSLLGGPRSLHGISDCLCYQNKKYSLV